MALGAAIGGYWGSVPGFLIGGAVGGLIDWGWGRYQERSALIQAFDCITQNLGYVATAYVGQTLAALGAGERANLITAVAAADTAVARAYTLVRGLFGGAQREQPTQLELAALITRMGANALVHGWGTGGTSDPRHDDLTLATASLIVHAFTPFARMNVGGVPGALNAYIDNAVDTGEPGKVAVRTCANYLTTAAHPGGNYCLSTSLVGKVQRGTIGPVGIILNVPAWNYLLIGPRDLNIDNGAFNAWTPTQLCRGQQTAREISENGSQTSLQAIETYTPSQLIAATNNYSELGVLGGICLRATQPEVTGIFVVTKNGNLCEDGGYMDGVGPEDLALFQQSYYRAVGQLGVTSMVNRIAASANQHRIPIVVIDNPHTDLAESNVALAGLTGVGGAWHGLTVNF